MDDMSPRSSRIISIGIALAAVGAIVGGSLAFAAAVNPAPEPTPVVIDGPAIEPAPFVAPISPEDEQIAEAAREAARIEAERIAAEKAAAEKAAAEEAARIAAEQEAARIAAEEAARQASQQTQTSGGGDGGQAPAPAPAPADPLIQCPGGSSATEVDGAGNHLNCMPNVAPNGGSCFEGDNGMLPECQPFRP